MRAPADDAIIPAMSLSILILTLNEEQDLPGCLESVRFCDDVVIFDSHSKDRTVEISEEHGARVVQRKFDNWSSHQNWAMENIDFKHDWVFYLDADERMTPELQAAIQKVAENPDEHRVAFYAGRKNYFMDRWCRRAMTPGTIMRFFKPANIRFERLVNPIPVIDGEYGYFGELFIHYGFSKGLRPWLDKHNGYSNMEAKEGHQIRQGSLIQSIRNIFTRDRAKRWQAIKNASFFLPARSSMRFLYIFIGQFGVFDRVAGFHYSCMISMYESWIGMKIRELESDHHVDPEDFTQDISDEPAPADAPKIDVVIPTRNEARHIALAVGSAKTLGKVFVLDSLSTDNTQELARDAGAEVYENPFVSYAKQKNWGLENLPLTGDWVYILDADELIPTTLRDEIFRVTSDPGKTAGYYINRRLFLFGRHIRHGGLYPSWNLRLFRRGKARYEDRSVHEHMICDGPTTYLKNAMLHIRMDTVQRFIGKHIHYANLESDEWVRHRLGIGGGAKADRLFRDALRARQWLRRNAWPLMPLRPMLRFIYMYVLRLGILDGRVGLHLAILMSQYEYMIGLLYREKVSAIRTGKTQPPKP